MRNATKTDIAIVATLAQAASAEMACWVLIVVFAKEQAWGMVLFFMVVALGLRWCIHECQELLSD